MSVFGNIYSELYDLLYQDKEYLKEAIYIEELIAQFSTQSKDILELGCGTCKHAEILARRNNYNIHGVDLSPAMIEMAKNRIITNQLEKNLSVTCADITSYRCEKKFDVVLSLFHVISYQTSNEQIIATFQNVANHLQNDGLFIFDFWYGPAVLTDRPTVRKKIIENDRIKVERKSEPTMNFSDSTVDVYFTNQIFNKIDNKMIEQKEHHKMRYFFQSEIKHYLSLAGIKLVAHYEWMTKLDPTDKSWYTVVVGRKC